MCFKPRYTSVELYSFTILYIPGVLHLDILGRTSKTDSSKNDASYQ